MLCISLALSSAFWHSACDNLGKRQSAPHENSQGANEMTNAININTAAASATTSAITTGLNWKRTGGLVRPIVYGLAFAALNFLLIVSVSYDYGMANVV
jgi:hypothetical protein